jgi:outer membrane protein assembly factor BamB
VLFSSFKEAKNDLSSNDKLIAIDKESGQLLWEWSDLFWENYEQFDHLSSKVIYNDILAFTIGSRNYALSINSGTTLWKNQTATSLSNLRGKNNLIYRASILDPPEISSYCEKIMEADIQSGNWSVIFEVNGGDSLRQGLTIPTFYEDFNGDELMLMANSIVNRQQNEAKGYVTPYLINYNKTKNQLNYTVQLDEPGLYSRVDWFPIVDNGRVFLLVESLMACHDIKTGNRIWAKRFKSDFLFSGAILDNGKIYANCEGLYPSLYCINAETGAIIWEKPSAGTCSPLQYHKGVLYFVGGSTGLLHIVNASNGKEIHNIKAPSQFKDHDDFFSRKCTVDKETDRLYVTSQTTAYCYPTVNVQ